MVMPINHQPLAHHKHVRVRMHSGMLQHNIFVGVGMLGL